MRSQCAAVGNAEILRREPFAARRASLPQDDKSEFWRFGPYFLLWSHGSHHRRAGSPVRGGERCVIGNFGVAVAKQLASFDHFRYLGRHHVLPGGVVLFDSFQDVARENVQDAFVEVVELFDSALFHQVPEQIVLARGYFRVLDCLE